LLPEWKEEKSPVALTQQQAAEKTSGLSLGPTDAREQLAVAVQWLPDAKHVVVNDISSITIVPVGISGPTRTLQLGNEADPGMLISSPPPILGPYQFLDFKTFLLRVNLQTGDAFTVPNREERGFCGVFGGRIYYCAPTDTGENKSDIELGTLDAETLTPTPLFHIRKEDHGEMEGPIALSRDGTRCALFGEIDDAPQIRLFRGDKLEKTLPVAKKEDGMALGIAEWSSDGKAIYSAFRRKSDSDDYQFGILEVPVSGGNIKEIPLFNSSSSDNDWPYLFQLVLSPDGRTAAMTSTCAGRKDIKPEDHGLYLVDLGSSARKVTKVPIPFAPVPEQIPEKK
jgi:hypothetical protein